MWIGKRSASKLARFPGEVSCECRRRVDSTQTASAAVWTAVLAGVWPVASSFSSLGRLDKVSIHLMSSRLQYTSDDDRDVGWSVRRNPPNCPFLPWECAPPQTDCTGRLGCTIPSRLGK